MTALAPPAVAQVHSDADLVAEISRLTVLTRIGGTLPDATTPPAQLETRLKDLYIAAFAGGWMAAPTGGLPKPYSTVVTLEEDVAKFDAVLAWIASRRAALASGATVTPAPLAFEAIQLAAAEEFWRGRRAQIIAKSKDR